MPVSAPAPDFDERLRAFTGSLATLASGIAPAEGSAASFDARRLQDHLERVQLDLAGAWPHDFPAGAGALATLRSTCGRIIATLRLWRELMVQPVRKNALRRLRRIRRQIERVRDLQLELDLFESLAPAEAHAPRTEEAVQELRLVLARELRLVSRILRPRRLRRMENDLDEAARHVASRLVGDGHPGERALPRIERRRNRALLALRAACERPDPASVREARAATRKWRDAEDVLLVVCGGFDDEAEIRRLGELVDAAGLLLATLLWAAPGGAARPPSEAALDRFRAAALPVLESHSEITT